MTGARVLVRVDDLLMAGALKRLQALGGRPAALMPAIGAGLVSNVHDRIDRETDPEGRHWPGLNPAYAALKSGPGMLRESGMRGGLQGSITFKTMGSSVIVGSNKVYAAVHQFGATIVPKSAKALVFKLAGRVVHARRVRIPARPYLGFGREDREMVMDVIDGAIRRAMRG